MNLGLAGKVALVGGASQGIGYAIARLLAAEGMSLAIAARREPALLAARDRIVGETGAAVLAVPTAVPTRPTWRRWTMTATGSGIPSRAWAIRRGRGCGWKRRW